MLYCFPLLSNAQNLVPNPSFEEHNDNLPCGINQSQSGFNVVFNDWFMPTEGTSDVFSLLVDQDCICHCLSEFSLADLGPIGSELPRTGDVMLGLISLGACPFNWTYREYAGIRLVEPLQLGTKYYGEMYVSHAEYSSYYFNNIGMFFSLDSIQQNNCSIIEEIPHVNETQIIFENSGWVKISGTFVADQFYEFLYLGNFILHPSTIWEENEDVDWPEGMYYFDDILVREACQNTYDSLSLCPGESITLSADVNAFVGWATSDDPETIFSTDSIINIVPTDNVTYLGYTECDTVSVQVELNYAGTFDLGNDTILCPGDSLILPGPIGLEYLWQDSSMQETYTVYQEGVYWLEANDMCGNYRDTIVVDYLEEVSVDLGVDINLCPSDSITLNAFTANASYQWQDSSTDPTFLVIEEGLYSVTVSDQCSSDSDEIFVAYYPEIPLALPEDALKCPSDSLELFVFVEDASYLWQDSSITDSFTVIDEGLYWVEVNQYGCLKRDSIFVENDVCEVLLSMPNVFSPNGDNVNDHFRPLEQEGFFSGTLSIYNRWGGLVFESENIATGWDGSCESEQCSPGTYFWVLEYIDINANRIRLKGDVTKIN